MRPFVGGDDGVYAECLEKLAFRGVGQTLVDDEDGVSRIPFASHHAGNLARRGDVESHEFVHGHSVGWSP